MRGVNTDTRLQPIDLKILLFQWKYCVTTSQMIWGRFFSQKSPMTAYKRILRLNKLKLLATRMALYDEQFVHTLTQKGFNLIKSHLPELKEEGFRSENISHDLLCSATLLGDWLTGIPSGVSIVTDQQMRRAAPNELPAWLPQLNEHRPDGIWGLYNGHRPSIHALEIEINDKVAHRYAPIGSFYKSQVNITRVLWLVNSKALADKMQGQFPRASDTYSHKHNFMEVNDYVKNEWDTRIIEGPEKGLTLREYFGKYHENSMKRLSKSKSLNMAKMPSKSDNYKHLEISYFSD